MSAPDGILCSKSHEYVVESHGTYTIGLTDYAVEQLGDIVFVELPDVGSSFAKEEVFGTVESVKAASEIYMPIGGKILEVNEALLDNPELLNESPYEKAWLVKIEPENFNADSVDLLEYDDYKEEIS
jgi:glycine cleavage system H protein